MSRLSRTFIPESRFSFMMIESSRVVGTGSIGARYLRTLSNISRKMPVAVPIGGDIDQGEEIKAMAGDYTGHYFNYVISFSNLRRMHFY